MRLSKLPKTIRNGPVSNQLTNDGNGVSVLGDDNTLLLLFLKTSLTQTSAHGLYIYPRS